MRVGVKDPSKLVCDREWDSEDDAVVGVEVSESLLDEDRENVAEEVRGEAMQHATISNII